MVLVARTISKKKSWRKQPIICPQLPPASPPHPHRLLYHLEKQILRTPSSPYTVQPAPSCLQIGLQRDLRSSCPHCGLRVVENRGKFYQVSQDCRDNGNSPHSPHPLPLLSYFTKPLRCNGKKQGARSKKALLSRKGRVLPERRQSQSKTIKSLCYKALSKRPELLELSSEPALGFFRESKL